MLCDSQLQVWYLYWRVGGNHSVGNVLWLSAPGMIFILDRGGWNFVWFSAQFLLFHLPKVKKYFSTFSFPLTESGKELVHFPHFTYRKWKKKTFSLSPFHLQKVEKWSNFFTFSFQLSPFHFMPARTGVIDKSVLNFLNYAVRSGKVDSKLKVDSSKFSLPYSCFTYKTAMLLHIFQLF